ncbi:glycosyltransferase [Aciditerrimonas ferrireducens]|uniref:Glycosyltransferase n=1 Tax=Aciditerrimonas ferrireducens TaxID=667306 RepID=A0ABV6C2J9_9ACTN
MRRLAVISLHTSPLAQPGTGDGGGMNVYVRELTSALARQGAECEVYTRQDDPGQPRTVTVEPGLRVHYLPAGPVEPVPKEALAPLTETFAEAVLADLAEREPVDAVHANYWLSGLVGHRLKHELAVPLLCTFHTLDRVKAEASPEAVSADEPQQRAEAEAAVMACSEAVLASCSVEAGQLVQAYEVERQRIRVVPPAVDHAFFAPGDRAQARRAVGLPVEGRLLLFVGRLQPLKGAPVALGALELLRERWPDLSLVVVGGPSGPAGPAHVAELRAQVAELGLTGRVRFVPPQPHELLSSYYRAADVCVVPSRSESFGLVALEAAACGVPVVASAVGGLTTVVVDEVTGLLVDPPDAAGFAEAIDAVLASPDLAERLAVAAVRHARRYTWDEAASRLLAIVAEQTTGRLVACQ